MPKRKKPDDDEDEDVVLFAGHLGGEVTPHSSTDDDTTVGGRPKRIRIKTVFMKPEKNNLGDFAGSNVKIGHGFPCPKCGSVCGYNSSKCANPKCGCGVCYMAGLGARLTSLGPLANNAPAEDYDCDQESESEAEEHGDRSKSTEQMDNEESDSELTNPSGLTSTPNIPPPLRQVTRSQRAALENTHHGRREEDSTDDDVPPLAVDGDDAPPPAVDGNAVESDDPDLNIPQNLFHTDKFGQKFNNLSDFDALFGEISVDAVSTIAPLTVTFGGTSDPCPKYFSKDNTLLVASEPVAMFIPGDRKDAVLREISKLKNNIPILRNKSADHLTYKQITVSNEDFISVLKTCGVKNVVFNRYGMKASLDWGWSKLMNIRKVDPGAKLFFDVGLTIPTSMLHYAKNTHGFKHEKVIPLARCSELKSGTDSVREDIGADRQAKAVNFPHYWSAQMEAHPSEVPTFGGWSLQLKMSTSEDDDNYAYLYKGKLYITSEHERKMNSKSNDQNNMKNGKSVKSRLSNLKKHVKSLEHFDPQVRIECTFMLKEDILWEEGEDMPSWSDHFDYVWDALMLMWKKSEFIVLDKAFCIQSMNRVISCVQSETMPRWLRAFNRGNDRQLTRKQEDIAHMVFACLGVTSSHSNRFLARNFDDAKYSLANSNFEWFLALVWNHHFRVRVNGGPQINF